MKPQVIPFGEWLPDLPAYANPGALEAKNVVPELKSYRSLNSLASYSNALDGVALGQFWLQDDTNAVFNFAGDVNKLYRLDAGITWTDVSGTSAPYGAENWEFTKFGSRVIAVNKNDPPQYYDVDSSSAFADLGGSPPSAKTVATVRDFVVLGDIASKGAGFIQWSAFNNSELWTPSKATQADFQEIFGRAGRVQKIVPGEFGLVVCEHSIYRMDYVGPPTIFQIGEVEAKRGTPSPNSVVWTGGLTYYFGWDGFYVTDGVTSEPISHNRVSNWFRDNCPADAFDNTRATIDRRNNLVIWAFRTSSSLAYNNRLLLYNWAADKWAYAELDTQTIDEYVSPGFDLDSLDGPLPGGIDSDSILVDSSAFKGGDINIMAFNTSNEASTFDGTPLTGIVDTKEISSPDHQKLILNSVRPLIEGSTNTTVQLAVNSRDNLEDNVTFNALKSTNGLNGEVNMRMNARYHRVRASITGGFLHADGVKANIAPIGGRR